MASSPKSVSWLGLLMVVACTAGEPAPVADAPPQEAPPPEASSLLGEPLPGPELDPEFVAQQEALLAEAEADLAAQPDDPPALIWVGRRTAYLGRYREAIEIYTRGIAQHPDEPRLYRHRGHRLITIRELDRAVADLRKAVELLAGREPEVEPDGLPNARNQPRGTTHSSAWYHLGLALYLQGEFEAALEAYRDCLNYSGNPDMLVATSYWLHHTLQRLGRDEEAARVLGPIAAEMDLIENHDYLHLLLLAKGERSPEDLLAEQSGLSGATVGYGVGRWYEGQGDVERARQIYRQVLGGGSWAAFGYLAAEAELARSTTD